MTAEQLKTALQEIKLQRLHELLVENEELLILIERDRGQPSLIRVEYKQGNNGSAVPKLKIQTLGRVAEEVIDILRKQRTQIHLLGEELETQIRTDRVKINNLKGKVDELERNQTEFKRKIWRAVLLALTLAISVAATSPCNSPADEAQEASGVSAPWKKNVEQEVAYRNNSQQRLSRIHRNAIS